MLVGCMSLSETALMAGGLEGEYEVLENWFLGY